MGEAMGERFQIADSLAQRNGPLLHPHLQFISRRGQLFKRILQILLGELALRNVAQRAGEKWMSVEPNGGDGQFYGEFAAVTPKGRHLDALSQDWPFSG